MKLIEYIPDQIWTKQYPVHYAGLDFYSLMTVIRLADGNLLLHSPCDIDDETKQSLGRIGNVAHIVAPGSYHYFHIPSAQKAFPEATTYVCPGIERKRPDLDFDWILGDTSPEAWNMEIEQVLVRGNKYIWEVAFFHKSSRTLVLVDLVENIGDQTEGVGWGLKLWWKVVFHMWNNPKPAPEYQMGWKDKSAARRSLERILQWDFERVILAHGDVIETNAKAILREAWKTPLKANNEVGQ
jgi:hypothetical protein